MNIQDIANNLVTWYNAGEIDKITDLYSDKLVSIENDGEGHMARVEGLEARKQKTEQWYNMVETHSMKASEPLVAANHFAINFKFDTTFKESGERMQMSEIAVYHVKDGKIVREQFWYGS